MLEFSTQMQFPEEMFKKKRRKDTRKGFQRYSAQMNFHYRDNLPKILGIFLCPISKWEVEQESERWTHQHKFHVPTWHMALSTGSPLNKVHKTQIPAAAHIAPARLQSRACSHWGLRRTQPANPGAMLTCASASWLPYLLPLGASEWSF